MSGNHPMQVDNVEEAYYLLDPDRILEPGTSDYDALYVERPDLGDSLIRDISQIFVKAAKQKKDIQHYFTGHTGSGKSTELRRFLAVASVENHFHKAFINIKTEFDSYNLDYRDFILVMARCVVTLAVENGCDIPSELKAQIKDWNKETVNEEITFTGTTGLAKLSAVIPFFSASEEVKTGGDKRKIVREKVSLTLGQFIQWIDQTVEIIAKKTGKRVLCVIDGLDHLDTKSVFTVLHPHHQILTQPAISQLWVVPMPLLYTDFGNKARKSRVSMVPNIPIYHGCDARYGPLFESGFSFFQDLIFRYCHPELFDAGVLPCLFELSAGHLRDMVEVCTDACQLALTKRAQKVSVEHVKQVWYAQRIAFTNLMTGDDYEILRRVDGDPYLKKGQQDLAHLIHRKAILFFPNGDGWYSLHPALKQKMDDKQPDCQRYA